MLNMSINTNGAALVALQNLNMTSKAMFETQSRINTGLKVGSAKDDSATFAIAQSLRADLSGLESVKGSLARAKSTLDVAVSATESISDVLVQMKEKALAAADTGLDQPSRDALVNDFNALRAQINNLINTAEFNGTNILTGTGTISALLTDDAAQVMTVANQNLTTTITVPLGAATVWANAAAANTTLGQVDASIAAVNTVLSTIGSKSREADAHLKFAGKLSDVVQTGIGNLVDADMAKESAKLQALQVKQQLGVQALSIANQAPQIITSLFGR
jgi:flagellin